MRACITRVRADDDAACGLGGAGTRGPLLRPRPRPAGLAHHRRLRLRLFLRACMCACMRPHDSVLLTQIEPVHVPPCAPCPHHPPVRTCIAYYLHLHPCIHQTSPLPARPPIPILLLLDRQTLRCPLSKMLKGDEVVQGTNLTAHSFLREIYGGVFGLLGLNICFKINVLLLTNLTCWMFGFRGKCWWANKHLITHF
jgi:hypothetical protein